MCAAAEDVVDTEDELVADHDDVQAVVVDEGDEDDSLEVVVDVVEDSVDEAGAALLVWKNCPPFHPWADELVPAPPPLLVLLVLLPLPLPLLLSPPAVKTTKFAVDPFGTVTTQKAPPPAPSLAEPTISLTLFLVGSIAQGRPLQLPSGQSILTPQLGISVRNGVAGSR